MKVREPVAEQQEGQATDLRGLFPEEIAALFTSWGQPSFRGKQVFKWLQNRAVREAAEMTDLPQALRTRVAESDRLQPLALERRRVARDGTEKYLWRLADGELIESVLMPYRRAQTRDRVTVCLSTQAGCALGCRFCATGQQGFRRNLTAAEIVGQVLDITHEQRLKDPEFKVTNLVFMGMGEPFLNYDNLRRAIGLFTHPEGQAIGQRRITVSTAGIVPGIDRFAGEDWEVNLALSLHAADDRQRSEWMPVNERFPLAPVLEACRRYWEKTRRRLSVEYALMAGVNDRPEDARRLGSLFKGWPIHLNLIPVNAVAGTGARRPEREPTERFLAELRRWGVDAVIREERGQDIEAACGQLRGAVRGEEEP
ncbi:23S rRNA (adenine(2503)-C(2))-methyltransferase RlmN [Heliobacterium gestii]|uniref:Probable dual-specificity RNA methyltransferase RlmN n=1 Tax=Heliomicrobium gestii TaxID=2699 RepID=A0A845LJH6_HELGE|nr:23S rRNA (adenine(2503)-C(2))-methyltransferase RlmN [Heliomicrobium gestii]MBM7867012.1 23S rRNA (adenine2503-C2)-methyltransferase [Heliomicrobium gestii]MZP43573.1 23S rRNA (adenine(2503)-C(2))-methyltransferase RlmN [Heliomicrobium gestii]